MKETAIVILNWNNSKDTIQCIDSLKNQTYKNFTIYLVDNGSKPNEIDLLETYIKKNKNPKIIFIKNKENLGFAGGNNTALKKAVNQKFVFLLNNDTTLETNCISELVYSLKNNPKIGAINPKIYYYSNKNTIWAAGAKYANILCKASLRGINEIDKGQYDKSEEVKQLVGAAVLIRSEALKKTGFFDEDYFCYYEETDLFHRMKQRGYKLFYEPKSIVYHKVAMSSGGKENPTTIYYLIRNRAIFIKKQIKGINKLTGFFSIMAEIFVRTILYAAQLNLKKIKVVSYAKIDILLNKSGKSNRF